MTRKEPIAEDAVAAPRAAMRRGSAIPERIPMIPQTNSKSMIANPPVDRVLNAKTSQGSKCRARACFDDSFKLLQINSLCDRPVSSGMTLSVRQTGPLTIIANRFGRERDVL